MSLPDRVVGAVFAVAYALRRSKFGFLRLHVAATLLSLIGAGYAVYSGWVRGFAPANAVAVVVSLLFIALMLWAGRRGYLLFRPHPDMRFGGVEELAAEQKLFLRGSGSFEVSNMRRYLVEVPVVFWSTELADHILAAKVRALNLLGVGVPSAERGWWYVFLEPRQVLDIVPGQVCFGLRCRPAVRVTYVAKRGHEVLHLSCDDRRQLSILLGELRARAEVVRLRQSAEDGSTT